ncbi:MAG: aspartate/tyrosine/aromatic aminotransferase [SAR324 cluster bacterium]|nr:aspartate/tyrosine/aromatic aminotransferase [SAR324 cluster bacterium]
MFEPIKMAPADPIMGVAADFNRDPNPNKINLSSGIFKDENDNTPILQSVKEAESRILQNETTKAYSGIEGFPAFAEAVLPFIFGKEHEVLSSQRAVTAHAPGGSGALRVVGDFVHKTSPGTTVWVSDPTWSNHIQIFNAAGLKVEKYPYFDVQSNGLAFEKMMAVLKNIPAGDAIILHGCCHNPTGVDPSLEQWKQIADLVHARDILPIIDFAYQGFGTGIREDAIGPLELIRPEKEALICGSFSKNFALYNERTGSVTAVARDQQTADVVMSQLKVVIRSIYSCPPAHGGIIVSTILNDPDLRKQWEAELKQMRDRINAMRHLLAETMTAKGIPGDSSFITQQKGMFSFSGLTPTQVQRLRDEYSIYIIGNGRINVAAVTPSNVIPLCDAIAAVI